MTVEAKDARRSIVRVVDPRAMLASAPGGSVPELKLVADDASERMGRVLKVLGDVARAPT